MQLEILAIQGCVGDVEVFGGVGCGLVSIDRVLSRAVELRVNSESNAHFLLGATLDAHELKLLRVIFTLRLGLIDRLNLFIEVA